MFGRIRNRWLVIAPLLLLAAGCSSKPITTGAAAYWEISHSEAVTARTGLQGDAAESFYPAAEQFHPTWDRVGGDSKAGAH